MTAGDTRWLLLLIFPASVATEETSEGKRSRTKKKTKYESILSLLYLNFITIRIYRAAKRDTKRRDRDRTVEVK